MQMEVETVCYQPPTHPTPHPVFQDLDNAHGSGNRRLAIPHPPHPTPLLPGVRQCKWKWQPYAINPPPTPPLVFEAGILVVDSWLLNPAFLVVESGFVGC